MFAVSTIKVSYIFSLIFIFRSEMGLPQQNLTEHNKVLFKNVENLSQ